ncbi:LPS translocon maturation chaperone LptM [Dyella sp. A6]|uniref:LPS translocon maturation chaperone LptM n=1 Tax=Dyella aluminiiresistens TaxID=3069105 RepID=UPI002E787015|nr:lipoprotein [Dyella sp. A6]
MRRSVLLLPFCLATAALAGCGNKGPLYLPTRPAPAAPAVTSSAPAAAASATLPAAASTATLPATAGTSSPVSGD